MCTIKQALLLVPDNFWKTSTLLYFNTSKRVYTRLQHKQSLCCSRKEMRKRKFKEVLCWRVNVFHFHGQWVRWQRQSLLAWNVQDVMWWVSRRSGVITTETHPSTSFCCAQQCHNEHLRLIYSKEIRKHKKQLRRRKSGVRKQSHFGIYSFYGYPTTCRCVLKILFISNPRFIHLFCLFVVEQVLIDLTKKWWGQF
jgi:hypothetical protein